MLANQGAESQAHGQNDTLTPSKTGSKSLLSSSESEAPPIRKNVPWVASVNTNHAFTALTQAQTASPLRKRHGETLGATQRLGQTANTFSPTPEDYQLFSGASTQASGGSRHPLNMGSLAEHLPSPDGSRSFNANTTAFQLNGASNLTPKSRGSLESHGESRNGFYNHEWNGGLNTAFNEPTINASFHQFQSHMDHDAEPFSPSYKGRSFGISEKSHIANGNPVIQLPHQSQDQHSELRPTYQRHITSMRTQTVSDERGSVPTSARSETFQNYSNQYFPPYDRTNSFGAQTTASPTASEYKRSFNSPFYSNAGTPPTGPESMQSASNSVASGQAFNGYNPAFERRLHDATSYRDCNSLQLNPLQGNFGYPLAHELSAYPGSMRMNPLANPYTMQGYVNMPGLPSAPRFQLRESEHPQMARSPLLEEFRLNNKNNKRYELIDIYNHVVEFSGDQHGSRFIQQKLETANSDEKDQIFTEIQPNSLQLMTDVFGNYVIQKLFEHGNQSQKKLLANQMKGHVLSLSTQMYGCRVVQKALEHVLTDQQASIVKELESHVLKCVKDQNGNHVIQKAIERVPAEHIQFIIGAFTDQVQRLATHPYGCRVIQRMLEHCEEPAKKSILQELHSCVPRLITDQFGNYVIQHVIENGEAEDKHSIVVVVLSQLLAFSKHKFASNVVEKSIEFAQEDQRIEILRRLTGQDENGESPVLGLMRDQYGNYVIRRCTTAP